MPILVYDNDIERHIVQDRNPSISTDVLATTAYSYIQGRRQHAAAWAAEALHRSNDALDKATDQLLDSLVCLQKAVAKFHSEESGASVSP